MTPGFAVYVHWPFCLSKCPYCDFNSHVTEAVDHHRWRRALIAELDHFASQSKGRTVTSIFFGGGTPSLMQPETAAAVIEAIKDHWNAADDLEITLEANPTSVEASRFADLRDAGVNRLSLGVQALDDPALKFLGRAHSATEAMAAAEMAAKHFPRRSLDFIYARPGQTIAEWSRELERIIELADDLDCEHLSLYQLTIEAGTPFARDRVASATEDTGAEMFTATRARLADAGRPAYEISNHARSGAACRHNLTYWQGGDYVGIGPGAHGRISGIDGCDAIHQIHTPERWLDAVDRTGHGTAKRRRLSAEDRSEELVMTGLRLSEGIDLDRLGGVIDSARLAALIDGGFLTHTGPHLVATESGLLCLNAVLGELLA